MRFTLEDQPRLVGFAARSSPAGEDKAPVVFREFVTSEDGERLIQRLTSVSEAFLSRAPADAPVPPESQIDHLIVLLYRDGRAEVWVNEPGFYVKAKVKRDVAAGQQVLRDDIADIGEMVPCGIAFPEDAGYVVLFSVGWRKGLVFDFSPLIPEEHLPTALRGLPSDVPKLLAGLYTYLLYRNRFILTEEEWRRFFTARWFPFSGLPAGIIDKMVQYAQTDWRIDDLLPEILEAVRSDLPKTKTLVASGVLFARHRKILGDALSAFERGQHTLAVAALYPRIEGLLREHHALHGTGKPVQAVLAATATQTHGDARFSLLLPLRFKEYLTEVFFGFEDFSDPTQVTRVSRHAVAHGVASDELLDEKAAVIGVLLVQQLAYLLPGE